MIEIPINEHPVYENGIDWQENAGDDFRRRLMIKEALGLESREATQEEWDAAVAALKEKENESS